MKQFKVEKGCKDKQREIIEENEKKEGKERIEKERGSYEMNLCVSLCTGVNSKNKNIRKNTVTTRHLSVTVDLVKFVIKS